jgi:hypothetical protein
MDVHGKDADKPTARTIGKAAERIIIGYYCLLSTTFENQIDTAMVHIIIAFRIVIAMRGCVQLSFTDELETLAR